LTDDQQEFTQTEHTPSFEDQSATGYRGTRSDPLFGLVLAGAISVGLIPIIDSGAADLRYTLVWGMLALFGVVAWLLGSTDRIEQEDPINLAWGIVFGLILSIPILAFVGDNLTEISERMFPELSAGTVLAYLMFVMPLSETLFFRGLLQTSSAFWLPAIICTIWQIVLFFPLINHGPLPLVLALVMLMANLLYGYVRIRNGLAAAWICQMTVNLILLFFPFTGL
jgi:membrane protease YdiL (CAAX protease family)